jgi:hypothetical protein
MRVALLLVVVIVVAACSPEAGAPSTTSTVPPPAGTLIPSSAFETGFPPTPETAVGPIDPSAEAELEALLASALSGTFESESIDQIVAAGDARVAWAFADLLRFIQFGAPAQQLEAGFEGLTGVTIAGGDRPGFVPAFDHLLAWDLPAWPGYQDFKRDLYTAIGPGWLPFFEENVAIDWRPVTWGGVPIDDRPFGTIDPCPQGCIPALDDPLTTPADQGDWYNDDAIIFGLVVNGEALALPRNQMQVHEMMNLTLGGVDLGIPYCTLCGSAQAYKTSDLPDEFGRVVLRTSGLLSRSNKVMYDLETKSVFDTFTGKALSGPLGEAEIVLEQVSVVSSTWGEWKEDHPDTSIIARDGGIGRVYSDDPLRGRDDDGPIFPTGPVDPRLPAVELVLGVKAPDGTPIAFPVVTVRSALQAGVAVEGNGLTVSLSGDGLVVAGPDGDIASHEAFWFAWSQFNPDTLLWTPGD